MKTGKLIGIILSVIVVLLIAYVLFSGESANVSNEQISQPQETSQNQITQNDSNYQTNEDLEKIKELRDALDTPDIGASKLYIKSCAPCHGKDGNGIIAPKIGGQSKDEILAKLKDYKENKVENTLMKGLFENISDENLTILADEISKF